MQKNKRLVLLLLSLCLILSLIPVSAFAAGTVIKLESSNNSPKAGDTFTVTISLTGNTGFSAAQFTLGFDKAGLECTSANTGSLLSGSLSATNPKAGSGAIVAAATTNNITSDGQLAVFQFKALKDVSSLDFTLSNLTLADASGKDLSYTLSGVKESDPVTPTQPTTPTDPVTPVTPVTPSEPTNPVDPKETGGQSVVVVDPVQTSFTDTVGHWAASYIEKAVERKIFSGVGNNLFKPNQNITRGQYITVLYRMAGSPETSIDTPFKDISTQSKEFQKAISWGYHKGLVSGKAADKFAPNDFLTRQESMRILFAYSGGVCGGEILYTQIYDGGFTDSKTIASWAKPAMYWGYYNKIISGTSSTTLGPKVLATRAQIAKILVDYQDNFSK